MNRRELLQHGAYCGGSLLLANRLHASMWAAAAPRAAAKSVIQIWLWGGPSHLDTFDPKPDAGYDYCGPLNHPIETNVSSSHRPRCATSSLQFMSGFA